MAAPVAAAPVPAPAPSGMVPMFDPESGKTVPVSASRVDQMQALGLTVDSPEAAEKRAYQSTAGGGELATSVGEGLASGATLGLSDTLAAAIGGDDYRHRRALRDETFEGPHKLAEGVGMVAPLLIPGGAEAEGAEGAGLLSRAAGALPSSLVARAAGGIERGVGEGLATLGAEGATKSIMRSALETAVSHGAAGTIEGGLQGAAQGISEEQLAEDHGGYDQLAESAWAGAKSGAMFGLFGGAALGGLTGAAEGASRGLLGRFGAKGDELAEAANERAVKATGARGSDLRRLGSEEKIQEVGKDIREYTLADGRPLLDYADNAESLAPKLEQARAEQGSRIGAFREKVAKLEPIEDGLKPRAPAEPGTYPDASGFLDKVKTEVIDPLQKSDSLATRRLAVQVQDQLAGISEAVEKGEPVGLDRMLAARKDLQGRVYGLEKQMRGPNPPPAPELAHLQRTERLLDSTIDQHMQSKLSPEDFAQYQESKRLYSSFAPADKLAEKAVGQNIGNRFFSPTDYATGIGTAASMVAGGNPLGPLMGLGVAAVHKQIRERGSAFLATLATRAQKVDGGIERSLDRYFTRVGDRIRAPRQAVGGAIAGMKASFDVAAALHATPHEKPLDAYDRIVARAQSFASGAHPQEYALDDHAPKTGQAMRAVQLRAAQYLSANAPVPARKTSNPNLGEMQGQMRPDPVQLYEFARRVEAVNNPLSVLKDLQTGRLSMAAIDAVKNVYPQTFQSLQVKVLTKISDQPKAIPYEDRIRLGLMFDLPTDTSLRPENLAFAQKTYQTKNPPVPPKTLPPVNLSKRFESTTERLENGDVPQ